MKYFYISFFFLLISCGPSKEELAQYQSQIKALNNKNTSLQNRLQEQESQLKSLNNLVSLQEENDSLPQVIKELDSKLASLRINDQLIGFETTFSYHLPNGVINTMRSLSEKYTIISDINPFFLKVNFAGGEGCEKYLVRIEDVHLERGGFILLNECRPDWYIVLGAGEDSGSSDNDLSNIVAYYIEDAKNVKVSYGSEGKKVTPPGEKVVKFRSSDGATAVYYSGEGEYKWEWIGS
ncbi:hypothetical protein [Flammeovirga aprica]|uniref:Lipoprotein n=1 Tax=Flammeovirga aprica JL-4 TaxID=694437 RepID=A0A7X9RSS7_9BACT|nr:hypothetical protein [Flammeovirga aprica]NME67605.1 hypothetical protein [Flammeovirga aprica JL-4]